MTRRGRHGRDAVDQLVLSELVEETMECPGCSRTMHTAENGTVYVCLYCQKSYMKDGTRITKSFYDEAIAEAENSLA